MTVRTLLRFAGRLLAVVALVGTGAYVIVYLWRWQWNRAMITGVLFLATLSVVSTWSILSALRRISGRLDHLEASAQSVDHVSRTLRRASAERASRHFDWLREPPDGLSVFVPILLGAGALLSGLAYVIERLAGATGGRVVDRTTARLLAWDLPMGEVTEAPRAVYGPGGTRAGGEATARTALAALGLVVVIAGSVWLLREATQSRDDPRSRVAPTTLELVVHQRDALRDPREVATALWSACSPRLPHPRRSQLVDVRAGSQDDRAVLVLDRTIGEHARRRLVGCMEDTLLDGVQADVWRLTPQPARPR